MPERRRWYEAFCASAQDFIESNGIKGNPQTVKSGGLESIPTSWDGLRVGDYRDTKYNADEQAKKVSGSKLVHPI